VKIGRQSMSEDSNLQVTGWTVFGWSIKKFAAKKISTLQMNFGLFITQHPMQYLHLKVKDVMPEEI